MKASKDKELDSSVPTPPTEEQPTRASDPFDRQVGEIGPSFADNGHQSDLDLLKGLLAVVEPTRDIERLAYRLLGIFGSFSKIVTAPERELSIIDGIERRILHLIKIVKNSAQRLIRADITNEPILNGQEQVKNYLLVTLGHESEEKFLALFLNSQNRLLADEVLALGTVDYVYMSPRKLIKRGLELHATAVILVHNHPSGNTWPSEEDITHTRKMCTVCSELGITIHDHYIVGNGQITSFKENGFLR